MFKNIDKEMLEAIYGALGLTLLLGEVLVALYIFG